MHVGFFKDHQRHGWGLETLPNEGVREGTWINDKKQGDYIFTDINNQKINETWIDDVLVE